MMIIDSSVWLGLINTNDSQHEKALKVFENADSSKIVLLSEVYSEVLTVLRLRVSKEACISFTHMLEKMNIEIHFSPKEIFFGANKVFFQVKKKLSFVDCLLLAHKNKKNGKLITFDKHLNES